MKKTAIAVYNPSDLWEKAIQDASKNFTGDWLPSRPCQMLARATANLKCDSDWLDQEELLPIRASHLFEPEFIQNKEQLVFVTHLLYLRDILENREINCVLHSPVSFVTPLLATFLFRECPVHIYVNYDLLRAANKKIDFVEVGGFLISEKQDIQIADNVITQIKYVGDPEKEQYIQDIIINITQKTGLQLYKAASKEIALDIFEIEEHYPDIKPGHVVWDKTRRINADVSEIEPGETGLIAIKYEDGEVRKYNRQEFDCQFVLV